MILQTALDQTNAMAFGFFMHSVGVTQFQDCVARGRNIFFQTWNVITDVTETFVKLSKYPVCVDEQDINKLEQYHVLLYPSKNKK